MGDAQTYCRVLPTFWTDPKVKRVLTREQKHVLLYLFTSPHTNMIGLYYLPLTYAENEAEFPRAEILEYLRRPLAPFATYDEATEEVLVHRTARHNIGEDLKASDNRLKAVHRLLRDAHSPRLVARFIELYAHWPLSTAPAKPPSPASDLPRSDSHAALGLPSPGADEKGNRSPLHSPLVSHSRSRSITEQELNTAGPPPPRADAREEIERSVDTVIRAANRGMKENARIGEAFNPIPLSHGSRQDVLEWIAEGIPIAAVESAVFRRAQEYQPDGRHRQISTMRYFANAVRDANDRENANGSEENGRNGRGAAATPRRAPAAGRSRKAGERRGRRTA